MHVSRAYLLLFGAAILPHANASAVSVSSSTTGGMTTTTITVTPQGEEKIRDFHIRPSALNTKFPRGATFGSSGWGAGNDNTPWQSWGSGSATTGEINGSATFTITVPATHEHYSTFKWKTTSNGSSVNVPTGDTGDGPVIHSGTSTPTQTVPFAVVALVGPSSAPIGSTVTYLADNPIGESETLSYTVHFSRSLEPQDSTRINQANMVPESLRFGLSTNSRTGTTTPGEGIRSATYFGNQRNHVILDVPDDPSLLGQTYYLQVEWSDGMTSAPVAVTFTSG